MEDEAQLRLRQMMKQDDRTSKRAETSIGEKRKLRKDKLILIVFTSVSRTMVTETILLKIRTDDFCLFFSSFFPC